MKIQKAEADERLFRGDLPDWQNNACPHWYASADNWSLIADGYRKAADRLVDSVIARDQLPDEMFYPILFLYRHYVELRLKEIIQLNCCITSGGFKTVGHDLMTLWGESESILLNKVNGTNPDDVYAIGSIIKQIQEIDTSNAEAFRYPQTKGGKALLNNVKHINLRHIRDVINRVVPLIDGAVGCLGEQTIVYPRNPDSQ